MARLGVANIDAARTAACCRPALWPRLATCSIRPSPASRRPTRILIVGSNPRIEASLRQCAHPQALAHGAAADRADRRARRPDLSLRLSRRRARDAGRSGGRPPQLRREAERRQAPADHRRAGRVRAARTGSRCSSLAAQLAATVGAVKDGWNGFSVLHTAASRVGALDLGFVPGEGGLTARQMARWRRRRAVQSRRRRDRHRARRLRDLSGHPWRPRRAPRRRHPAGRDLHRKVRHLRQHGRPRADGEPRRLRARRGPRGLGDPARPVRRARPPPAVRLAQCAARRSSMRSIRISRRSTASQPAMWRRPSRRSPAIGGIRAARLSSAR